MTGNRFGTLFQYTTWGESHGSAIGCVVDGVPPRIPLSADDIQLFLDRRKPAQSKFTTQRREDDVVQILSGVFDGVTTGAPISLLIPNTDQKSKDYSEIKDSFRPGHADYTMQAKYGVRDYRGGGRASARETASRVAAGAIAHKILTNALGDQISITAYVTQIGPHKINSAHFDAAIINQNPFFAPDAAIVPVWADYVDQIRKDGLSIGAIVECVVSGIPAGLGAPHVDRLDADIAKALMSIQAVKGVEIGDGFDVVSLTGVQNADEMRMNDDGSVKFLSNHAGGILGGISTGQDIVARCVFKPTSSILTPVRSINKHGQDIDVMTKGRHDPCVGIRGVPVVEAMMASVLADHWLRHKAQCL